MFTLFCPNAGKSEAHLPLQSGFVILFFFFFIVMLLLILPTKQIFYELTA